MKMTWKGIAEAFAILMFTMPIWLIVVFVMVPILR